MHIIGSRGGGVPSEGQNTSRKKNALTGYKESKDGQYGEPSIHFLKKEGKGLEWGNPFHTDLGRKKKYKKREYENKVRKEPSEHMRKNRPDGTPFILT